MTRAYLRFLAWLPVWLLLIRPVAAQAPDVVLDVRVPEQKKLVEQGLPDSLAALERYQHTWQAAAAERVGTYLLARFPDRVQVLGYSGTNQYRWPDYPQQVYQQRAALRQARRDWRGAEADLTAAIRYTRAAAPPLQERQADYYRYHAPLVQLLRETYYARAQLRLDHLGNRSGGCADLAAAYPYDTVRAGSPTWRGCPLPATRLPLDVVFQRVLRQRTDSMTQLLRYLDTRQVTPAARLLTRLRSGRLGPYQEVPPIDLQYSLTYHPERNPTLLAARTAALLGQPARGRVLLDSLLARYVSEPWLRYQRGIFLIDNKLDAEAGCQDLRWVYDHDSTRTGRRHPRWRGCPLPRYKVPVGAVELAAYRRAYQDSLALATQWLATGRAAPARRLLSALLATGTAGHYAPATPSPLSQHTRDEAISEDWLLQAYDTRTRAYLALGEYQRAAADLDTLVQEAGSSHPDYYCRRGVLRADYLHDQDGACRDLTECYNRGRYVPGARPARGCDIAARHLSARLRRNPVLHVFDDNYYPVWQGGYVRQGDLNGIQVGRLFNANEGIAEPVYGPGVGVELAGNATDFVLAPRLSYEAAVTVLAGRLDATYYLNQRLQGDLRLTPQLGISALGLLNFYYGYAFPVAGTPIEALGNHRFTIYLNLLKIGKIGG